MLAAGYGEEVLQSLRFGYPVVDLMSNYVSSVHISGAPNVTVPEMVQTHGVDTVRVAAQNVLGRLNSGQVDAFELSAEMRAEIDAIKAAGNGIGRDAVIGIQRFGSQAVNLVRQTFAAVRSPGARETARTAAVVVGGGAVALDLSLAAFLTMEIGAASVPVIGAVVAVGLAVGVGGVLFYRHLSA